MVIPSSTLELYFKGFAVLVVLKELYRKNRNGEVKVIKNAINQI